MRKNTIFLALSVLVVLIATARATAGSHATKAISQPVVTGPTIAAAAAAKPEVTGKTLGMAFISITDFGTIPIPLIGEKLKASGIELKPAFFSGLPPARTALLRGDVEFMQLNLNSMITSNQQGANLRALMRMAPNYWVLIAPVSIKTPAELNGKRVGIHGPGTLVDQLVKASIKKYNFKPNVLVVPGTQARLQAMINKQLDATPSEMAEFEELSKDKPGEYHVLINYAKDYPFLTGSTLIARKEFIEQNPALVQMFVSAYVEITNEIRKNPESVRPALRKIAPTFLPKFDMKSFDAIFNQHLAIDYWNPELTSEMAQKTVQFMKETDQLKGDAPDLDSIVDLRFFEKAKQPMKR